MRQRGAAVGQPADRLGELPHHVWILGRAEVQAVGDRNRPRPGDRDVAVGLGERQLCAGVRVQRAVPGVAVGGHRDPKPGARIDPQHTGVGRLGEHGVAAHVTVVLVGNPGPAAQVRAADHPQHRRAQLVRCGRSRQPSGVVGDQRVLLRTPQHRPLVHRTLVRDRARRHVHHRLALPGDHQSAVVGDLTDHARQHVPLRAHRQKGVHIGRPHDRAHPLLGLAGQDLRSGHPGGAQRHRVQVDPHAALARAGQLARRAGQPGAAEILDADHQSLGEQLKAALDQHLLGERVADLHAGQLLAPAARLVAAERVAGQHGYPTDAIQPGPRAEQDHLVADPGGVCPVQVLGPQHPDAQRVDQRVSGVGRVEHHLAADRRQPEAVPVATDPGDHTGQHPGGVRRVRGSEPQRVEHRRRAGTHGQDVPHDPADPGRRTLVWLHIGRMVVRLDLERDRPTVADVDHAGVLADPGEHPFAHLRGGRLAEVAQVHLGGLVGAVLAPHHRVHRQLGLGRPAAENRADPGVLVVAQPELAVGLRLVRAGGSRGDGVDAV